MCYFLLFHSQQFNRNYLHRMIQFISCTMGMCEGSLDIQQESNQQRISQMHAKGQGEQNTVVSDHLQRNRSQAKKIFSFRLNGFRRFEESDKQKNVPYSVHNEERDTIIRLHHCKSSDKPRIKQSQFEPTYHEANRFINAFSPLRPQSRQQFCSNDVITSSHVPLCSQTNGQKHHQAIISAPIPPHKSIVLINKKSSQAQLSFKTSENSSLFETTKITSQRNAYTFQEVLHGQKMVEQKCEPQNLYVSFMSKNSNKQQKISGQFPTFVHLESTEAPKFFEDVKTIKTIVSKQSFYQDSMKTSIKEFNEKYEDSPKSSHLTKTEQIYVRKQKKKTAFFNVTNQRNETQKTLIDQLREDQIRQDKIEQQSDELHFSQKGNHRTVKFCLSPYENAQIKPNSKFTKQNRPISKCINKIVPSLHNLVQSSKRHQISIGNSIKQLNQPQENPFKYKYVNTIKSIGGQSIFSENSYIDIKYMQSINSKRTIHKLI